MVDFCVNDNQGNDCGFGMSVPEKEVNLTGVLKCLGGLFKQVPGSKFLGMQSFSCNATEGTSLWLPTDDDDEVGATLGSPLDNATRCCPMWRKEEEQAVLDVTYLFLALISLALLALVASLILHRQKPLAGSNGEKIPLLDGAGASALVN